MTRDSGDYKVVFYPKKKSTFFRFLGDGSLKVNNKRGVKQASGLVMISTNKRKVKAAHQLGWIS